MDINNALRYELKIPLESVPVYEIRKWINLHPHGFRNTFPSRRINNLYFDSIDYSNFQAHLAGYYERSKVRLRWYGEETIFSASNLEIKSKYGNLGNKKMFLISEEIDLQFHTHQDIFHIIEEQLPEDQAFMLSNCRPVIINFYQREYFESVISGIRLTIDYDHFTFDQRSSIKPNISFSEPFHNTPIIEIKAPKDKYKILSEVLSLFPASTYRFSKYMDGMLTILGR